MSLRHLPATAALIAALVMSPSSPALAAAPSETPTACTVGGVAVPEGSPVPEDIPVVVSCFDSVAEAEQFIGDGAPGDYEQLQPRDASSRTAAGTAAATAATAAATVIVGKVWTGASRSGSVLIHWGSGSGCYGVTFGFPSLAAGWNNNIRSAEGFANCWSSHYDSSNYGGSAVTCSSYCANLGTMAARTSSIVYRSAGSAG